MKHLTRISLFALALVLGLTGIIIAASRTMQARQVTPVADFVAPLSPEEAQQRVAAAQQAQQQQLLQRAAAIGSTSIESLPLSPTMYVAQSGHHLSQRTGFLNYWREHGGVLIFGYPITEEIIEDGRIVQYFEKARFEYHPEAEEGAQIKLSLLGSQLSQGREFEPGSPESGQRFFPETNHSLSGVFLQFWQKRGGLPIFGYPISEPFEETIEDGSVRIVQYFERARFEHHSEQLNDFYRWHVNNWGLNLMALYEVRLTDLGRQAATQANITIDQSKQLNGTPEWSPANWQRRIDIDLTKQWLTAYEGDIEVFNAPVATGKDGFNTPTGTYAIYLQYHSQNMQGSGGGETWDVPNVPWVQYVVGGVALHGTYWHDQWGSGVRMSHGCINLNIDDAQWLFDWADIGTTVNIHY